MKIYRGLFILTLLSSLSVLGFSQSHGTCGLEYPEMLIERVIKHQATISASPVQGRSSAVKYVPMTFILIGDDSGNGAAREEQALEQLHKLNADYAPQEIVFYMDELRYKNHSLIFSDPGHPTSVFQMKLVRDPNALNVYVTQDAQSDGGVGTTLAYYSPPNDWLVIRKDRFNGSVNNGVLMHEVGHFFSLPHTFNGWDCVGYSAADHGNPVSSIWAPCNGSVRNEFQNGTNCANSGDYICDTAPDYNFGFGWSVGGDQCAEYTPQIMDPNGDVINVVENNAMGYFLGCTDYMFSPMQQAIIEADYLSSDRNYLRLPYVPALEPVDNAVVYNYPINGEETASFNNIDLDWEDVPGATDYLVIVARNSGFSLQPERYIVQESFITLDELTPNVNYFWRVWPFNESQTGAGWATTHTFRTGLSSAVETISSVDRLDVFPNPAQNSGELTVLLESSESFDAEMTLVDITGRQVWYQGVQKIEAGIEVQIPVVLDRAVPGLYFLKVQSSKGGVISRKVSIL